MSALIPLEPGDVIVSVVNFEGRVLVFTKHGQCFEVTRDGMTGLLVVQRA